MKLVRDSFITLITRILTLVFGLAILSLTTRALGAEGRGVYAMVVLVITVLKMISSLGIEVGNVYYLGRNRMEASRLLSNSVVFAVVLGFFFMLGFLLFNHWASWDYLQNVPKILLSTAVMALPFL